MMPSSDAVVLTIYDEPREFILRESAGTKEDGACSHSAGPDAQQHEDGQREDMGQLLSARQLSAKARFQKDLLARRRVSDRPQLEEFKVWIVKDDNGAVGIDVLQHEDRLSIVTINAGPLEIWNRMQPDHLKVRVGDFIVEANETRGHSQSLVDKMKCARHELRLVIGRPKDTSDDPNLSTYSIQIRKEKSIGIQVEPMDIYLQITQIDVGPIAHWNSSAALDAVVRVGDLIVDVNGRSGTRDALLHEMRNATDLHIQLKARRKRPEVDAVSPKVAVTPSNMEAFAQVAVLSSNSETGQP